MRRSGCAACDVSVAGNGIGGASVGVAFSGGTLWPDAGLRDQPDPGGRRDSAHRPGHLPERAIVVSGATDWAGGGPGLGTGRSLAGIGDPNTGQVAGNAGEIYQRIDPSPGPRLFVKRPTTHRVAVGCPNEART
jgi:hypothetical protein